jgi:hypothetical protein
MSAKFLEGFGGKLAEQWVANLLTPAFVFWSGGILAYIHRHGWDAVAKLFPDSKIEALQLAVLACFLLLIYISALVVQRFDTEILRGLEGYWYPGIRHLFRPYLTQYQIKRKDEIKTQWKPLNKKLKAQKAVTSTERANFVRYDRSLRQFPNDETDFLPTRLGNLLRAAERRSYDRYGLDAIVCWPRLWLILPENTKKELQEVRTQLNNGVRIFTWSILFLGWSYWSLWVLPVAIVSAIFAYCWILDTAEIYGDLLESAFDLHRIALYQSLRFPLPKTPQEEHEIGLQVTEYLFRGTRPSALEFTPPASNEKK